MTTSSGRRRISWLFLKGAYGVFDDVRSSRTFVQADSEPRVRCHDKRWRLRFVVAQTAQLRINFKVVPKSDASWGQSPLQRNRFQSPTTPHGTMLPKRQINLGGPALCRRAWAAAWRLPDHMPGTYETMHWYPAGWQFVRSQTCRCYLY